jgi:chitodextrinase
MTLEAWVDPSTINANWRDVIYKANDNFYLSATSTNGSLPDAGTIAGGSYADAFGTAKLTANSWAFLTATYDGSTVKLYLNGTQVASTPHTGAITTSTNPLQIGGDSLYGQYFAGLIDNVRVYNVALTAAQIQTDQATSINATGGDTTPPSQPGALSATAISNGEVDLSWGASTDNVGVTGYHVERCSGAGCSNFVQVATATGTTYKDTTVSASTSYSYRVRAFDAAGNQSVYSSTASASTPAASSGLVAAYGFDEGSGTTVTDASGNGNNGTISGATWSTTGKYGDALNFNGTSSLVTIPDSASLHLSTGMTLEAWVDPSTINANWRDVIYKANDNFYLSATSTNASLPDGGTIAGGSYADAFGTAKLTANSWAFLTATYDGSTVKLYVNGTQVASTPHTGAITTSTNPLQIGGDSLYGQYFAGLIDNVRVYNVALTAAQIQTDQTSSVNPAGPPDTTPPSQPGTLSGSAVSGSEIDLSWGASTDNVGVTGYRVERCQGTGCSNFTQIATVAGATTTYQDTTVNPNTSYSYRVRATDSAGNLSPYSNTTSTTTPNTSLVVQYTGTDANGIASYNFTSSDDGYGTHVLRVLQPTNPAPGVPHNFLYVLPVEPELGASYGDGIETLESLNAQNQYNLTIVEPAFPIDPWYADNPTDPQLQFETFMTKDLVPWVTQNLEPPAGSQLLSPLPGAEQNWLIGFSKSGIGGQDLILKHPDVFGVAASWDFPADMASYSDYGSSSESEYGTDANFQANYRLTPAFLDAHKTPFLTTSRIWIGGYNAFETDVSDYDALLTSEGIDHVTETPALMAHRWDSGWVPIALSALSQEGAALAVTP